jgi:hypothetical protein
VTAPADFDFRRHVALFRAKNVLVVRRLVRLDGKDLDRAVALRARDARTLARGVADLDDAARREVVRLLRSSHKEIDKLSRLAAESVADLGYSARLKLADAVEEHGHDALALRQEILAVLGAAVDGAYSADRVLREDNAHRMDDGDDGNVCSCSNGSCSCIRCDQKGKRTMKESNQNYDALNVPAELRAHLEECAAETRARSGAHKRGLANERADASEESEHEARERMIARGLAAYKNRAA